MIDMVPKAIMLNLVTWTKENMQGELLTNMYKTDELGRIASRWWRAWARHKRLSTRCSN
jgi:hypothetical protein